MHGRRRKVVSGVMARDRSAKRASGAATWSGRDEKRLVVLFRCHPDCRSVKWGERDPVGRRERVL
jgi:hypothetical protein